MLCPRTCTPRWKRTARGIGGWWVVVGLLVLTGVGFAGVWLLSRPIPASLVSQPLALPPARLPAPVLVQPDPIPVLPEQVGWLYRHQTSQATQALVASGSLVGQGQAGAPAPQVGVVFTAADRRAQVFLQNMEGVTACEPPQGCRVQVQAGEKDHEWTAVSNQGLLVFPDVRHNQEFLQVLSEGPAETILVLKAAVVGGWPVARFSAPLLEKEKLGLTSSDSQVDAALLLVDKAPTSPASAQNASALVQAKQAVSSVFSLEMSKRLQIKTVSGCLPSPEHPARAQVQVDENGLPRKYEKQWDTQEGLARKVVYYDAKGNTRQAVLMSRDHQGALFKLRALTYLDASGAAVSEDAGLSQDGDQVVQVPMQELAEDPWQTMEAIASCAALAKTQQAPVPLPASQDFVPAATPPSSLAPGPENTVEVFLPAPDSPPVPVRNP